MKPKTKRLERIALCGKRVNLVRGSNGIRKCVVLFCGYYTDCDFCGERQTQKRKKIINRVIFSHHGKLFRTVIDQGEWKQVRHKLNYRQTEYIRVPQPDGKYLLITSDIVPAETGASVETSHVKAIEELTERSNLYAPGQRSTSRNWKFKNDKPEYSETIEIYELIPAFVPTKQFGEQVTIEVTDELFLHAATWTHGPVDFSNLQQYANHVANKAISMAIAKGIRWDVNLSRMVKSTVGKEELENWARAHVDQPNLVTEGDVDGVFDNTEYLLEINAIEPHDHVADYIKYTNEEKLRQELGDLYNYFYPESMVSQ